jgi:hypothetical protein
MAPTPGISPKTKARPGETLDGGAATGAAAGVGSAGGSCSRQKTVPLEVV